jgi:pilus assembly protein CpaC
MTTSSLRLLPVLLASGLLCMPLAGRAAAAASAEPTPPRGMRCGDEGMLARSISIQLGKSTLMRLPEAAVHRSVGNPAVVQAMLVAPDTLYLVGMDIGASNMIIQGRSGACTVIDVAVGMDVGGLQASLAALLPDEKHIRVSAAADSLVLSGTVQDSAAIAQVMELAEAFARRPVKALSGARGVATPPASQTLPPANSESSGVRVVNLLSVTAPQQVMLEVKIAEVSKSLLDQLEVGSTLRHAGGSWATTLLSNFLTGTARGLLDVRKANGTQLTVAAQQQDGLIKILAEPTVMAISGQEGSFLAGGKIFIPVSQDNNKITLEEKEFGVGLRFTPTVLAGGRINLKVAPEVSEVSRQGIGISASGFNGGAVLPLITTRRASTTVQLYDGQSFAIGGLIKNNLTANLKSLPVLGEVPVLGALFRSTDFQQDRSEMVFVITARLVKPQQSGFTLPTDRLVEPSRKDVLLGGRLEGRAAPADASAPAPATEQQ